MDSREYSHSTAERAYYLWEEEGRPSGKAIEHWLRAEAELAYARAAAPRSVEARAGNRRSRRKRF